MKGKVFITGFVTALAAVALIAQAPTGTLRGSMIKFTNGSSITEGTTSPEGNRVAAPGSLDLRTSGLAYIKAPGSGTDNSGWESIESFYSGSGNPQGVLAADLGRYYRDTATGRQYVKKGGGSTAYGWYPQLDPYFNNMAVCMPTTDLTGSSNVIGCNFNASQLNPGVTLLNTWSPPGSALADGFWRACATAAAATSQCAWNDVATSSGGLLNWTWDFDATFIVKTGNSTAQTILWIGTVNNGTPGNVSTLTKRGIIFRFSTVSGDSGWRGVTFDGTTQAVTAQVGSNIATNTVYRLRVRNIAATDTACFSVNDGTETCTTSNVPNTDAVANLIQYQVTQDNNAKTMLFKAAWVIYGSL